MSSRLMFLCIAIIGSVIGRPTFAGSQETTVIDPSHIQRRAAFSKKLERAIAARAAEVALVARVGRPRSKLPPPIQFTHVGIAIYSNVRTASGENLPGYIFYNLYQSKNHQDKSYLVADSALNYFAGAEEIQAGVIIPIKPLQQRIKALVTSTVYNELHRPTYSLLANPDDTRYQNCTEFVLDILTASIYQTTELAQIKANHRAHFRPTELAVSGGFVRLAGIFNPAIHAKDHTGPIRIATFYSIGEYLRKHNAVSEIFTLSEDSS